MMGRNRGDDMAMMNNLELRNAIDGIDEISFLLSRIDIKTGEEIDLGSKGVYVVKQKEALSIIARDHGYTTKELVKLNPWLFDDNRIKFNYPKKVLIKEGTVISDEKDHILKGTEAKDILKDHNGGNDTLYGYGQKDTLIAGAGEDTLYGGAGNDRLLGGKDTDFLYGGADNDRLLGGDDSATDYLFGGTGEDTLLGQGGNDILAGGVSWNDLYSEKEQDRLIGGSGYDIYYVSHSDIIDDADYSGVITFNGKSLAGKKQKVDDAGTTYEDDYFVYAMNGNDMVVVEKATQEYVI